MILIDISEPFDIENLIKQSVPVSRMPLNQTHRSDYYFVGADGLSRQFSRKQADELLSDIDEAEDQLRDYYNNADRNYLIIEGIISPVPITRKARELDAISIRQTVMSSYHLFSYKIAPNGYIFGEKVHNVPASMLEAWLQGLDECGVGVIYTVNSVHTAKSLVARYKNAQKPAEEHTTLRRIIKPKIITKSPNPYVKTLMGIAGAELGEVKAEALIEHFGNPFSLFMASVDEICEVEGIGRKTAEKILRAIGREVE